MRHLDTPVISATCLTRRFGDVTAVDCLTLEVCAGEVFGFLGHNGAGKTTTVRLLNGVLEPSSGTTCVLDLDPVVDGPALRRRTGVLTESPSLDERLTGRENLEIYAELYGIPPSDVSGRIDKQLADFELASRAGDRVSEYSKGMKQRLALARALLHGPEVLFLDEPTTGLDPLASHRVHEMIKHLSAEHQRTVFLCTHNLAEAQTLCDRVAVLEHGRLVALGTPAALVDQLRRSLELTLEIAPAGATAALECLRQMQADVEMQPGGGRLTVKAVQREAIPDLVSTLVAAGVRLFRVEPQEPSLEDVYFALHGEQSPR